VPHQSMLLQGNFTSLRPTSPDIKVEENQQIKVEHLPAATLSNQVQVKMENDEC
jgi:hypothetical protein